MTNDPPYPWLEFSLSIGTWDVVDYAYPDTGFEGGLIVPKAIGRELLASAAKTPIRLANGEIEMVDLWRGVLDLDGHRFHIDVIALGPRYLIGRDVLDQMEVCFEFGQRVRLRFGDEQD